MNCNPFEGFKDGDKVRVVLEGTLDSVDTCDITKQYYVGESRIDEDSLQSVELIDPDYEHGAIYMDALGHIYQCDRERLLEYHSIIWWTPGQDDCLAYSIPQRPLRKLVPES